MHTWLVALRVLLQLGDELVEVFLLLVPVLQRASLQVRVISLYDVSRPLLSRDLQTNFEQLFFCGRDPVDQCRSTDAHHCTSMIRQYEVVFFQWVIHTLPTFSPTWRSSSRSFGALWARRILRRSLSNYFHSDTMADEMTCGLQWMDVVLSMMRRSNRSAPAAPQRLAPAARHKPCRRGS